MYANQQSAEVQLAVVMANQGAFEQDYQRMLDKAAEIQQRTMYGDETMITGAAEISTYLSDPAAIETAMDTLSMYAAGMSGGDFVDQQQMLNFATQLGKAFDGNMSGMTDRGFSLTDAQKEAMELADDLGRVEIITEIIADSWDGLDESFRLNSARGQIAAFQNDYGDMQERLGQRMEPAIMYLFESLNRNMPYIEEAMTNLADAASIAMIIGAGMMDSMGPGLQFVTENVDLLVIGLGIVIAAYIAMKWTAISAWLASVAPILLVIAAIGVAIAVLSHFGITGEQVLEAVGGAIFWVGGLFKNIGLWAANAGLGISEVFWAVVENIQTAFSNAGLNIKSFFLNLLSVVLGFIAQIAEALSKLPFVEFDYEGIASQAQDYADASLEAQRQKGEYANLADAWNEGFSTFEAFEEGWGSNAFQNGQKWAGQLGDKLGELTDAVTGNDFVSSLFGNNGYGDIDEIDRVGSVGKIDDDVTISEEDIKLLKDIAAMDYQLYLTQLTPQFNAQFGDIHETADWETGLSMMENWAEESLQSNLVVSK